MALQHTLNASPIQALSSRAQEGTHQDALLWILGIPLPIIILLALFWR
jgi:hypothetical protein